MPSKPIIAIKTAAGNVPFQISGSRRRAAMQKPNIASTSKLLDRENGHHRVSGRVQMLKAWAGVTVTVGETQQGKRAKADCTEQGRNALTSLWSYCDNCAEAVAESHNPDPWDHRIARQHDGMSM